jgi:prepilin-type N-terminal cleavage/methylation domain-containing protein
MSFVRGFTLCETLICIVLFSILLAVSLPGLADLRSNAVAAAGVRQLAVTLHALRWKSVARARVHGLAFERQGERWRWFVVSDGNGNGLRSSEIASGVDPTLSGPHVTSGVRLGFPGAGPFPRLPPGRGSIVDTNDPLHIGNGDLLSFGPLGSASGGTLYLTDGRRRLYAIVVYGPTARITVRRYDQERGRWTT